jgi:hypothetical protein
VKKTTHKARTTTVVTDRTRMIQGTKVYTDFADSRGYNGPMKEVRATPPSMGQRKKRVNFGNNIVTKTLSMHRF